MKEFLFLRGVRAMYWQTHKAQHWLYLEAKKEDCWVGVFWRREQGDWGSTLDVWVCLLPCLPIHYIREGGEK